MYTFCLITVFVVRYSLIIILLTDPIPEHCKERSFDNSLGYNYSLSEIPVAHALCILGGAT